MSNLFLAKANLNSALGSFNILISENEINQMNTLLGIEINQNNEFILKYKVLEYIQIVVTYLQENIESVELVNFSIDNNIDLDKFHIYKFSINPQLSLNLSCLKQDENSKLLIYKFFSIFEGANLPKIHNYNIDECLNFDGVDTSIYTSEYLQNRIADIKYLTINFINNDKVLSLYFNEFAFSNTLKLFANKILSIHKDTDFLVSFHNIDKSLFLGNIIAFCIKSYLESFLDVNLQIGNINIKKIVLSDCLLVNIENSNYKFPIYVSGFDNFEIQIKSFSNQSNIDSVINKDAMISLGLDIGSSKISANDLCNINNGDIILLDETYGKDIFCINLGKVKFFVKFNQDENKLYFRNIDYI